MKRTAVVIGAGPAGLSAAIGFLRVGFGVQVLEQRPAWKGRVCGSFINADGAAALAAFGLLDRAKERGAVAVAATHLFAGAHASRVPTLQRDRPALAFPRRDLESLLEREVRRLGGNVRFGSRAGAAVNEGDGWRVQSREAEGVRWRQADVLVRAGGRFATTPPGHAGGWFGWNARFAAASRAPGTLSMHFGRSSYAGILVFSDGTMNVCGLTRRSPGTGGGWEEAAAALAKESPSFDCALEGATRIDDWLGVGPLPFGARPPAADGSLLVGDAAAVGDPFMGEGIGRALATGPMIERLVRDGGTDALAERWRRFQRRHYAARVPLGRAARWILNRPSVSSQVLSLLIRPAVLKRAVPIFHGGAAFSAESGPL